MTALRDFLKSDYMAQYRKDPKGLAMGAEKGKFDEAAKGLGSLGKSLDEPKNPTPGGLDGMDMSKVQAFSPMDIVNNPIAQKAAKKAYDWVTKQGKTTIIIENRSSKVLSFRNEKKLIHPKDAKWERDPPPSIAPGGKDTIIVKTDMLIRGAARADTSGWALYEVDGEDRSNNSVKIAWLRKGDGHMDDGGYWSASGKYEVEGFQSKEGEFTFWFTEKGPVKAPVKDDKKDDKKDTQPKIRQETIVVGAFEFGDDTINKIKPIGDWFDYSKLSAWYDKLPEATKEKMRNGQSPGGKKIVMTGFTDNVGNEFGNLDLGSRRAIAVAKVFEKLTGVALTNIVATPSKGEQPVREEDKKLEKKEPKNRRVEVVIHIEE